MTANNESEDLFLSTERQVNSMNTSLDIYTHIHYCKSFTKKYSTSFNKSCHIYL